MQKCRYTRGQFSLGTQPVVLGAVCRVGPAGTLGAGPSAGSPPGGAASPISPPPPGRRRAVVIAGAVWMLLLLVTRALELMLPVTAPSFRS